MAAVATGACFVRAWGGPGGNDPLFDAALSALFGLAALLGAYRGLSGLLNTVVFEADARGLTWREAPFPWPRSKHVPRPELVGLRVRDMSEEDDEGLRGGLRDRGLGPARRYALFAVLAGGAEIPLDRDLESAAEAHFVREQLEEHFGLDALALPPPSNLAEAAPRPRPFGHLPSRRPLAGRPSSVRILSDGEILVLKRRWAGPHDVRILPGLLLGCLVLYGLIRGIAAARSPWDAAPGVLVVLAALGFLAFALRPWVNATSIEVDGAGITIEEGPLPPRRRLRVPRPALEQLYVEKHSPEGRGWLDFTVGRSGWDPAHRFALVAVLGDGRQQTLLDNLWEKDEAIYLEQQIEARLGLVDVPVAGELGA